MVDLSNLLTLADNPGQLRSYAVAATRAVLFFCMDRLWAFGSKSGRSSSGDKISLFTEVSSTYELADDDSSIN